MGQIVSPPKLTKAEVQARIQEEKKHEWPWNRSPIACTACSMVFTIEPGDKNVTLSGSGNERQAWVYCPNCESSIPGFRPVYYPLPEVEPSWWDRFLNGFRSP